jgi:hypothetical protein
VAKIHLAQTNFSSGALDPTMRLRVDTGAYQNGAKRLKNVVLENTGGCTRRPGGRFIATLAGKAKLYRFKFDDDERYVFCFSNYLVEVYRLLDDKTLIGIVALPTPYTTEQCFQLTFAQQGDVTIIFHPTHQPYILRRIGLSDFAPLSTLAFRSGSGKLLQPYYKFADDDVTLRASADTGTVTITASAAVFTAAYVGRRIRMLQTDVVVTGYIGPTQVTGVVQGVLRAQYDLDPFRTIKNSKQVTVTHPFHGLTSGDAIEISGANDVGGIPSTEINGSHVITVTSEHAYRFNVATTSATASADGGGPSCRYDTPGMRLRDWAEEAFSATRGWPSCGVFHQGRLFIGGSPELPTVLCGSYVNDYFNFGLGEAEDTAGIMVFVGQEDVSRIRHLVSASHLQIFTDGGEYYVPQMEGQPLTPLSITARKQTPFGIGAVAPWPLDNSTLYVQKSGTALREFIYTEQERSYASNSLSFTASHLMKTPVDMAVTYGTDVNPEQYSYIVNSDGTIAMLHSARVERLAGFTEWEAGEGSFRSVTTVDGLLFACVERYGSFRLESFVEPGLTLDGARTFTNATALNVWPLGIAYAGLTVWVVSLDDNGDVGFSYGECTADGAGTITLPVGATATQIVVGHNYEVAIETLPPVVQTAEQGPLMGEIKRIVSANVGLQGTLGVTIDGTDMILRQANTDLSLPPEPFTGFEEFRFLGYGREPTITVTQVDPLPLKVLGLVMKVSI